MYFGIVAIFMFAGPLASVAFELVAGGQPVMLLVGKWFVFWAVGLRLLTAGIRQYLQPAFTARAIFHMRGDESLPVIRELGVSNFAVGLVATASLWQPAFTLPMAIVAAIFYGFAGFGHLFQKARSANEQLALVSDLFAFAVLAAYVGYVVLRGS